MEKLVNLEKDLSDFSFHVYLRMRGNSTILKEGLCFQLIYLSAGMSLRVFLRLCLCILIIILFLLLLITPRDVNDRLEIFVSSLKGWQY